MHVLSKINICECMSGTFLSSFFLSVAFFTGPKVCVLHKLAGWQRRQADRQRYLNILFLLGHCEVRYMQPIISNVSEGHGYSIRTGAAKYTPSYPHLFLYFSSAEHRLESVRGIISLSNDDAPSHADTGNHRNLTYSKNGKIWTCFPGRLPQR